MKLFVLLLTSLCAVGCISSETTSDFSTAACERGSDCETGCSLEANGGKCVAGRCYKIVSSPCSGDSCPTGQWCIEDLQSVCDGCEAESGCVNHGVCNRDIGSPCVEGTAPEGPPKFGLDCDAGTESRDGATEEIVHDVTLHGPD